MRRVPCFKDRTLKKVLFPLLLVFAVQGCALIHKLPPHPPLAQEKINFVVSQIQEQEERVRSFFSSGRLVLKEGYWEQESHILMAVVKEPRQIKVEITDPWGRPVAHLLLDGKTFRALSFAERKAYDGEVRPEAVSNIFPGQLDSLMIWDVLRAYPSLRPCHHPDSRKADQITLVDDDGKEIQTLDLDPERLQPMLVSFPGLTAKLAYSGFQEEEGILYAREVKVIHGDLNLTIHHEKMVFNKPIPKPIFTLDLPPGFEIADPETLIKKKRLF
jgi:outer membrane lipoprotein-sorting protein